MRPADLRPERLLDDLNAAQREAVKATLGPVAIVAGAGSGKTRVISRRAAFAIESGAVLRDHVLLVTFTDKAAGEMAERMAALGHAGVMARTFHAAALAQLRHFWPDRHAGEPLPAILASKATLLAPLVRRLPGAYRFVPTRDVADAIERAKVRRIAPAQWVDRGGDRAPIPADLFARLYRDYEAAKERAGRLDFEDLLVRTVELLEADAEAAALVRARKRWFSVDEYQDTNPLAERLLELWVGDASDVAVVGDPDQTIYTFTGASPEYLLGFAARHPGARTIALAENYRSTREILALANRLVAAGQRGPMTATRPPGPPPTIRRHPNPDAELAAIVAAIRNLVGSGEPLGEIAILVRTNAQLVPVEQALTRAAVGYRVRGQRFFERPEVRDARHVLRRARIGATGPALAAAVRALLAERLGLDEAPGPPDAPGPPEAAGWTGDEARERQATLELLLQVVDDLAAANPAATSDDLLAELERRDAAEASGSADGVNLLTYHRAKGLEWDAVFLPALEEGLLPIRQAKDDDAIAEERRLLYVGITRARRHLALSWSERRPGAGGRVVARRPSRFLATLERRPLAGRRVTVLPGAPIATARATTAADGLMDALRAWRRERSAADAVPAYVVAADSTLADIADARPRTVPELRRIRGIGPAKLERYGGEILAIVGRFG